LLWLEDRGPPPLVGGPPPLTRSLPSVPGGPPLAVGPPPLSRGLPLAKGSPLPPSAPAPNSVGAGTLVVPSLQQQRQHILWPLRQVDTQIVNHLSILFCKYNNILSARPTGRGRMNKNMTKKYNFY
uniref:Uncharacterized protein n=1 Tax=Amphimedon queenslandica TaxID=400682 RepID=A0A1X7T671_AMPQE